MARWRHPSRNDCQRTTGARPMMKLATVAAVTLWLTLPAAPAHAEWQCAIKPADALGTSDTDCWDDGNIDVDDEDLTPAERAYLKELQAKLNQRLDEQIKLEKEMEAARRAKCTVAFLGIGCPAKQKLPTAE